MKKILFGLAALFGLASVAMAAPAVTIQGYTSSGLGTTVSVSTSAWTLISPTTRLNGMTEVWLTNDEGNTSNMVVTFSTSTTAPTEPFTVKPGEARPGVTCTFTIGSNMYLWAYYLGAASANVHYKEFSQGW